MAEDFATDIDNVILIYTNELGHLIEVPLCDLQESGNPVDPESDEELELIGYHISR